MMVSLVVKTVMGIPVVVESVMGLPVGVLIEPVVLDPPVGYLFELMVVLA
jgi:hypothetical protein